MEPKIIYEDSDLLILDKPTGWTTAKAETTKRQSVIEEWLEKFDYPLANDSETRSGIVHRLDKGTSGILLVAKTKKTFANLQGQFKERQVEKTYLALVHGRVHPPAGEIEVPVGRLPWRRDRFGVLPGGRPAVTSYQLIKYFKRDKEDYSLLEARPKSGRTHQIRVHLKYLGHPIVADEFYAGRKTARKDRVWCPRLFLHAAKVAFRHPASGKRLELTSDLPQDLVNVLNLI